MMRRTVLGGVNALSRAGRRTGALATPASIRIGATAMHRAPAALSPVRSLSSHPGIMGLNLGRSMNDVDPRCSVLCELPDKPGALFVLLSFFWKHEVQLTAIESRPVTGSDTTMTIQLSFSGTREDPVIQRLVNDLSKKCRSILVLDDKVVPWFPRHISDLDKIANRTLDAGGDLEADHPGFSDQVYRQRRGMLASIAETYRFNEPIPRVDYEQYETDTWGAVYDQLEVMREHACKEYREILPQMEAHCGYSRENIPQAQDISDFLMRRTGFRLRPVAGLLSSRDFLNGLAFRVFFSTQYIRHSSRPLYTPEPDICHELLGHAPMFADADFADFSQEVGLASLGASDEDIKRLATCYWHTVEFGLLKEDGRIKAYGAGVLSSFGEMEHACVDVERADAPTYLPWDPIVASTTDYPITTYQPTYFVADSLHDAKKRLMDFTETLPKPFYARYNALTSTVWVDRAVKRAAKEGVTKVTYGDGQ